MSKQKIMIFYFLCVLDLIIYAFCVVIDWVMMNILRSICYEWKNVWVNDPFLYVQNINMIDSAHLFWSETFGHWMLSSLVCKKMFHKEYMNFPNTRCVCCMPIIVWFANCVELHNFLCWAIFFSDTSFTPNKHI